MYNGIIMYDYLANKDYYYYLDLESRSKNTILVSFRGSPKILMQWGNSYGMERIRWVV